MLRLRNNGEVAKSETVRQIAIDHGLDSVKYKVVTPLAYILHAEIIKVSCSLATLE